jgi:hypothetical protein
VAGLQKTDIIILMKIKIAKGFFIGVIISILIYILCFFLIFAPLQHKDTLARYNQSLPMYNTFLECKKCEKNNSKYNCALEVVKNNSFGRFENYSKYEESLRELYNNRLTDLKNKCQTKSLEELKKDPYLLGSRNSTACDGYSIGLNLTYGSGDQCEIDVKAYCRNPEESVKSITDSGFVEMICAEAPSLSSPYSKFLQNEVMPPIPKLQDEYSKITDVSKVTDNIGILSMYFAVGYLYGYIIIIFWIIFAIIFIVPPLVGILIGFVNGRKKKTDL